MIEIKVNVLIHVLCMYAFVLFLNCIIVIFKWTTIVVHVCACAATCVYLYHMMSCHYRA